MDNKVQIATERLLLREYIESDWEAVHDYARQGNILIYEAWGPNTETDTKQFIKTVINDQKAQPRTNFDLAIILNQEQKLIGGCRFGHTASNQGSVGYIINPLYWGNGYATEATTALIDYAVAHFKIQHIEATCDVLNIASQRVLEKCGFILKRKIERDLEMRGRDRDTYVYYKEII